MFEKMHAPKAGYSTGLLTLIVAAAFSASSTSAPLLVPQDFATIQAAVDAASSGDEVLVDAGLYAETVDFSGKSLVLRSVGGPDVTTLAGTNPADFNVIVASGEGPGTQLDGFTVTGGGLWVDGAEIEVLNSVFVDNVAPNSRLGGGIYATNATLMVANSTFDGNAANSGGGIQGWLSDLSIDNCTFVNNHVPNNGGGVGVAGGSLVLTNSTFEANSAGSFGSGLDINTADVRLDGLTFKNNGSATPTDGIGGGFVIESFAGGGVFVKQSTGSLTNSVFDNNVAFAGGGIYLRESSNFTVANSLVINNRASLGSAFYINTGSPLITNVTALNNLWGIGFFAYFNSYPQVVNSIFAGNGGEFGAEFAGQGESQVSYSLINGAISETATQLGDGNLFNIDLQLDADFRPTPGSPVIDAGNNSAVPTNLVRDLDGNDRFVDDPNTADTGLGQAPLVDLGAFELQVPEPATVGTSGMSRHTYMHTAERSPAFGDVKRPLRR